jgi:predicted  nucleic acid-binding Zn-ribbon protein
MDTKQTIDLLKKMQDSLATVQKLEDELTDNPERIAALEADTALKNKTVQEAEEAPEAGEGEQFVS